MTIIIDEKESIYMYDLVKNIINEIGPRISCSAQELKAALVLKDEFEKKCDETELESFTCSPVAFLGWTKLISIAILISFIIYFISIFIHSHVWSLILAALSFFLIFISLLIIWEEFFNYREFIDNLFKKKKSQNIIGKFRNDEKINKILIFSGHIDTALEFNLLRWLGWASLPLLFGALIISIMWLIISFLNLIFLLIGFTSISSLFLNFNIWLFIVAIPCFISVFLFIPFGNKGNVVPGAVDNLSSCSVLVGLSRYINKNREIIPRNIEIRLIIFGCEECGLRGAFRYVEKYLSELKKYDTLVLNMDGLETPDKFNAIEYEPTTKTRHSEEVIEKIIKAAKQENIKIGRLGGGKKEKLIGKLSGGSDAAAFSKAGIKAGFLNSADWKTRSSYYHQRSDTPDKIKNGTLENALKICIRFIINESNV